MRTWRAGVVRRIAHPGRGFTQGLIADGETVWESTGLYGQSTLCRYPLGSERAVTRTPSAVPGANRARARNTIPSARE